MVTHPKLTKFNTHITSPDLRIDTRKTNPSNAIWGIEPHHTSVAAIILVAYSIAECEIGMPSSNPCQDHYIPFHTNAFGKGMNLFLPPPE